MWFWAARSSPFKLPIAFSCQQIFRYFQVNLSSSYLVFSSKFLFFISIYLFKVQNQCLLRQSSQIFSYACDISSILLLSCSLSCSFSTQLRTLIDYSAIFKVEFYCSTCNIRYFCCFSLCSFKVSCSSRSFVELERSQFSAVLTANDAESSLMRALHSYIHSFFFLESFILDSYIQFEFIKYLNQLINLCRLRNKMLMDISKFDLPLQPYDIRTNKFSHKQQKMTQIFDDDNEVEAPSSGIGIEAILSSKLFSNRASSLYLAPFKTYYDIAHSYEIQAILLNHNPNIAYSLNVSQLWKLLKYKLKMLNSKVKIITNDSDRRVIYFSTALASNTALNDAKQKVFLKNQQPLRSDLKQLVQKAKAGQFRRRKQMLNEFNQSQFFNSQIPNKLNLSAEKLNNLKETILDFKMQDKMPLYIYFQRVLSFIQRTLKQNEQKMKNYNDGKQQSAIHQAYSILLLCIYLCIYICYSDWANNIDKNRSMEKFYLSHIIQRKGFGILQRFLDDAPINVLIKEIKQLQGIYFR